jgi:hypothetical protein
MGGAWNRSFKELQELRTYDFLKGAGLEFRLESISFNSYPFSTFFRTAYGMDNPEKKERLRYQFGITFSFDNWDVIDIPDYLTNINKLKKGL